MAFYHVTVEVTPLYCRTNSYHYVISEDPLAFLERNKGRTDYFTDNWELRQYREIDAGMYERFRRRNPSRPDPKYQKSKSILADNDWAPESQKEAA